MKIIVNLSPEEAKELSEFKKKRHLKNQSEALRLAAKVGFKKLKRTPTKYDIRSLVGLLAIDDEKRNGKA